MPGVLSLGSTKIKYNADWKIKQNKNQAIPILCEFSVVNFEVCFKYYTSMKFNVLKLCNVRVGLQMNYISFLIPFEHI